MRNTIFFLFFLFFTSVLAQHPGTQTIYFEQIPATQELSSYSITDIEQDHLGFIWIATINGVNCFDGYNILSYNTNAEEPYKLSNNRISQLAEDKDYSLWMYDHFHQKLFRMDSSRSFTEPIPLPEKGINSMKADLNKILWLFSDTAAYWWNSGAQNFQKQSLNKNTSWYELLRNDQYNLQPDLLISDLTGNTFPSEEDDSTASIALEIIKALKVVTSSDQILMNDIVKVNEHSFWVATSDQGICIVEKILPNEGWKANNIHIRKLLHHHSLEYTISSNHVTTLFKDKEGSVWVGTFDKGIKVYFPAKHTFSRATHIRTANDNWAEIGTVRAIAEDQDKNLWIGTQEKGVMVFDQHYQYKFSLEEELPCKTIRSIHVAKNGTIWIGHYKGLSSYNPAIKKVYNYPIGKKYGSGLPYLRVYEIREDEKENLWISFWFFLIYYNPATGESEKIDLLADYPHIQEPLKIRCFDFLDDHKLWIGTENYGLFCYDILTNKSKQINLTGPELEENLLINNIFKITFSSDGKLLLSSSGGLFIYDPVTEKTTYPKYRQKVNRQRTYAALEDGYKGIWVSTVSGMWYYHPQTDSIRLFDYYDGLSSNEFTKNGLLKREDGSMVFGCNKGIIYFRPDEITLNHPIPTILVQENGWQVNKNSLAIHLRPTQKSLQVQAKVINYLAPGKVKLAYRLKGWEEEWHFQSAENPVIFYENVPEGEFTLEIKAFRNGTEKQAGTFNIAVTKSPPFWKTNWFIAFMLFCVCISALSIHRKRLNWVRKEKELQIRHYESELKFLKSQISPHFLFNTLNNIYSLCILEPQKASIMVMNLSKMLRYMLYECQGDRVSLAKEVNFLQHYIYMQQEKGQVHQNVQFEVTGNPQSQTIVPLLLISFVENSFKHSDLSINPNGYIRIRLGIEANQIIFSICNTFTERGQKELVEAGGLGIENTRKRLELFYPDSHTLKINKDNSLYSIKLILQVEHNPFSTTTKQSFYEVKSDYY